MCSVLCSLLLPRLSSYPLWQWQVYIPGPGSKQSHVISPTRSQHSSTRRRREAARRRELATCHARTRARVALSPEAPCRAERSTIFGFLLPRPLEFLRYFCALPPSGPGLAVPSPASALTAAGQPWSKAKGPRRRRRRHRLRRNATSASPSGPWRRPAPPSYPPSSSTPSTSPRYAGDPVVASISSREENLVG